MSENLKLLLASALLNLVLIAILAFFPMNKFAAFFVPTAAYLVLALVFRPRHATDANRKFVISGLLSAGHIALSILCFAFFGLLSLFAAKDTGPSDFALNFVTYNFFFLLLGALPGFSVSLLTLILFSKGRSS